MIKHKSSFVTTPSGVPEMVRNPMLETSDVETGSCQPSSSLNKDRQIRLRRANMLDLVFVPVPYAPCMEYLPSFTINSSQVYLNIPYMEHLSTSDIEKPGKRTGT